MTDRVGFTDRGRFLLNATQPELLEREAFNQACSAKSTEKTAVLGCYSAGRTYIFNVNNEKLNGIEEVTTAHEMLHAAYERLDSNEKQRINRLLDTQGLGASEERIKKLMLSYAKTEPGERLNELHSILATEVAVLDPVLENYYRQYFVDRSAVVRMATSYQTVFDDLVRRQEALVSELNDLASRIDTASGVYASDLRSLNAAIQSFNSRAGSGSMTRQEYDSERVNLIARQRALRSSYDAIQALVALYDSKKSELEAINTESSALNHSINSSLSETEEIQ